MASTPKLVKLLAFDENDMLHGSKAISSLSLDCSALGPVARVAIAERHCDAEQSVLEICDAAVCSVLHCDAGFLRASWLVCFAGKLIDGIAVRFNLFLVPCGEFS